MHNITSNRSFVRKNLHGAVFSAEKGNLYSKHSYKYSGELFFLPGSGQR